MVAAGDAVDIIEEPVRRVVAAYGVAGLQIALLPTSLFVQTGTSDSAHVQFSSQVAPPLRLDQIDALYRLVKQLERAELTAGEGLADSVPSTIRNRPSAGRCGHWATPSSLLAWLCCSSRLPTESWPRSRSAWSSACSNCPGCRPSAGLPQRRVLRHRRRRSSARPVTCRSTTRSGCWWRRWSPSCPEGCLPSPPWRSPPGRWSREQAAWSPDSCSSRFWRSAEPLPGP